MAEPFESGLVSIITPCYNGAKVLPRLLDSLLAQTYSPIEYIFVNDGSTDDTEAVFFSYRERLEAKGIRINYIQQENRGLGGAVDTGLKVFTGEFLAWIDADDYLEPDSVEKRVQCFYEHPDCAVVTSDAYVRNAEDLSVLGFAFRNEQDWKGMELFEKLLMGESVFSAGSHLVRSEAFVATHPDRSIYPARRGQNWQMLLPLYYRYSRVLLREPLFHYLVSDNSMSKDGNDYDRIRFRYAEHETILTETLLRMEMDAKEREHYTELVRTLYAERRLQLAAKFGRREHGKADFETLKRLRKPTLRDRMYRWIASNRLAHRLYQKRGRGGTKKGERL